MSVSFDMSVIAIWNSPRNAVVLKQNCGVNSGVSGADDMADGGCCGREEEERSGLDFQKIAASFDVCIKYW